LPPGFPLHFHANIILFLKKVAMGNIHGDQDKLIISAEYQAEETRNGCSSYETRDEAGPGTHLPVFIRDLV